MNIVSELKNNNIATEQEVGEDIYEYTLKNGDKFWIGLCNEIGRFGVVEAFSQASLNNFFGRSKESGWATVHLEKLYEVQKISKEEFQEFFQEMIKRLKTGESKKIITLDSKFKLQDKYDY